MLRWFKLFLANIALMVSFSLMHNSDVCSKVISQSEGFLTNVALVGSFSFMDSFDVISKGTCMSKGFLTNITLMIPFPFVYSFYVCSKVTWFSEFFYHRCNICQLSHHYAHWLCENRGDCYERSFLVSKRSTDLIDRYVIINGRVVLKHSVCLFAHFVDIRMPLLMVVVAIQKQDQPYWY